MSEQGNNEAVCQEGTGAIALIIRPREKDLGGFSVRRVLPAAERRMVGPFVFFDHMGPASFPPGKGISVRPHPHIGLATITYLFEGEIMHRDSLGFEQPILAGAVNLMTAGRGIVHSERAGSDFNDKSRLHGIQSWMALPESMEEIAPDFVHTPAEALPEIDFEGCRVRLIMGEAFDRQSPVKVYSPTLYMHVALDAGATLRLPSDVEERGFYVVDGNIRVDDQSLIGGEMAVLCEEADATIAAETDATVMVVGGAGLGHRFVWWNFVSSSKEKIEAAKTQWRDGGFGKVPGDDEFIPLPGE
ncbi:MAG: pirin family protein [Pseudomonadota bacterium]